MDTKHNGTIQEGMFLKHYSVLILCAAFIKVINFHNIICVAPLNRKMQ